MFTHIDTDAAFRSLGIFFGAAGAGLLFYVILERILVSRIKNIQVRGWSLELKHLRGAMASLLPALAASMSVPLLEFSHQTTGRITHLTQLWVIVSAGWLAIAVTNVLRDMILSKYDMTAEDNLAARRVYTQIRVIENIVNAVIVVITGALMLMSFPGVKQVGVSLLASAGVLGIILGFAAQKTLGNLIAGIQIALAQPIRLEDAVVVEGEWGWIEEITLTYVVIRVWDLRRLIVPISYFTEKPFQNWTRTSAEIIGSVFIHADYTVPFDALREELTRILEKSPHWNGKVNVLQVTDAKERTVEMRALMSASTSPRAWDLRCEVREKLIAFVQKNFPEKLPRVRVEMDKAAEVDAVKKNPESPS